MTDPKDMTPEARIQAATQCFRTCDDTQSETVFESALNRLNDLLAVMDPWEIASLPPAFQPPAVY